MTLYIMLSFTPCSPYGTGWVGFRMCSFPRERQKCWESHINKAITSPFFTVRHRQSHSLQKREKTGNKRDGQNYE